MSVDLAVRREHRRSGAGRGNQSAARERRLLALQLFDHVVNAGVAFFVAVGFDHDGGSLRR